MIQDEKLKLINSVTGWNWENYCKKHLELWNYILNPQNKVCEFDDGLNSLLEVENKDIKIDTEFVKEKTNELTQTLEKQKESLCEYGFGRAKMKYTLVEKIFSIKNSMDKTRKIISILGLKIKIKRKKK